MSAHPHKEIIDAWTGVNGRWFVRGDLGYKSGQWSNEANVAKSKGRKLQSRNTFKRYESNTKQLEEL